jgi:PAS domain S-box-containing protein
MTYQTITPALLRKLMARANELGETPDSLIERALNQWDETQPSRPTTADAQFKHFTSDIVSLIPDAVVTLDEAGSILYFNPSAAHIFGYDAKAIVGQSLNILLPDAQVQTHHQHIKQFLTSSATHLHMADRRPVTAKHRDGRLFPVEISIVKHLTNGKTYLTAIIRDITQREATVSRLRESEKLLHLFTENVTDMLCVHDPDGIFIYVNPAAQHLSGYAEHELIGKDPYEFFHPDDIPAIQESHTTSLTGQYVQSVVYRWRCKDGTYIWLDSATTPILDEQGHIQNLVTISRDITQRREMEARLRQEHALFSSVASTSPSGIVVVNRTGTIIYANQRAEAILGISTKKDLPALTYDAPAWKHTDYDGNPWRDEQQPFVRVMETKQPVWDVRHAIETSDGKRIFLVINGAPIFDEHGEVNQVVFTVEDYTERKLQQDALEEAYDREKKLNALKTEFISMVSHEFRTPMSIITTSTGILRMKYAKTLPDDFLTRIAKIDAQIMRLSSMVGDITFINKADMIGHALEYVPIDLSAFFSQLADELHMAYPQHSLIQLIEARPTNPVLLDLAMMQHIFVNLLTNALKYSPEDKPVVCQYDCDGAALRVIIRDKGIGIPEEDQSHLFEVFHRAHNVGNIPGTGLGLAIVKRAINALNGSIQCESHLGVGTTFYVVLPVV